jgi:hypothetical protein
MAPLTHAQVAEIRERYEQEAAPPPAGLDVPRSFHYIHFKAYLYLLLGPDAYREGDALGRPPAALPELRLDAIRLGCQQILAWSGLTPDRPLRDIGVDGFYALMRLFHFRSVMQAALDAGSAGHVLDRMDMQHIVSSDQLRLYNLVTMRHIGDPDSGPPCPYCGAPLRTSRARQCRACGTDWHDPEHVISRKSPGGPGSGRKT